MSTTYRPLGNLKLLSTDELRQLLADQQAVIRGCGKTDDPWYREGAKSRAKTIVKELIKRGL